MTSQDTDCSVDVLMEKLPLLGEAVFGCGPKHPTSPQPELQKEIDTFLGEYPFLQSDKGYVHFLETYAGAFIESRETGLIINLLGFSWDISQHLRDPESDVVDPHGFLTFATTQVRRRRHAEDDRARTPSDAVRDYIDMAWSFDASQKRAGRRRQSGIYRHTGYQEAHWFCADFGAWLNLLVAYAGNLENVPAQRENNVNPQQ